ncbi:cysteine desulfurase family protein [Lacticaseibacillus thailandensis]|uniref:Cysteine desulfurase n=1 Tax=Lacticaseibacillus thailandensis DSM 22698 = JCM 13996 TaxID=1423810 RepID=A0A0R2CD41_9LACO|nr:cysteine desulfurase family protein [Lacticaseibacillus thailandensis]KRM87908.1 cysteine desulfurase [Lacticaseibacillus thailandensis DSM 22698 = JCM 13996]
MIYFDNSATTKPLDSVLDTYRTVATDFFGNPSSLHNLGDQARAVVEQSRAQIAQLIHAQPEEIYFTSGGTEGDNWIIKGTAMAKRQFGKHLITTQIEHPAVRNSMAQLEKLGFDVTYLPVDSRGFVSVDDVRAAIRPDTIMVSVMAVNNEVGSIQPIDQIGDLLQDYPTIHYHVDAVQSVGKGVLAKIRHPRIDFLTFSGHKFHAPRGTGFIFAKAGRMIDPLMAGGGQERDWRSGTENTPGIAAMAKALRVCLADEDANVAREQAIRTEIANYVNQQDDVTLFSQLDAGYAPHILTLAIAGVRGETIVHAFEHEGIFMSTTSACSSRSGDESSTLKAMHVPDNLATSAIRISLDEQNTMAEAKAFERAFDKVHAEFQKLTATSSH